MGLSDKWRFAEDRDKLLNVPIQAPGLSLHDAGEKYDQKVGGPQRHLHVRRAYGVYEAAWEGAPLDAHRLHALDRDKAVAENRLREQLLRRIAR